MQINLSLILNVLLLIGVMIAIGRLMKSRRRSLAPVGPKPSIGLAENKNFDDIIAVRKVPADLIPEESHLEVKMTKATAPKDLPIEKEIKPSFAKNKTLMIFLLAKENRQFAGYELLQTVLSAGLRYGEGNLFHRHQNINGQGPVLCSLAAATSDGIFDLHNIGAFSVRGLCLFMQASGNPTIDSERLHIMYETAKQLSDGLDAYLLNDQRHPLTEAGLIHYRKLLNL